MTDDVYDYYFTTIVTKYCVPLSKTICTVPQIEYIHIERLTNPYRNNKSICAIITTLVKLTYGG